MKLPIEVIPNTDPPQFRWQRTLDTLDGEREATHEGTVPCHLEAALVELIEVAHKLQRVNDRLDRENQGIHAQLIKCQERVAELSKPATVNPDEPAQRERPRPGKPK